MKRLLPLVLTAALMCSAVPAYAAQYQDNIVDRAGDRLATLGKKGMEKDRILIERKAKRAAKFAEHEAKKAAIR